MISVSEAQERILAAIKKVNTETLPIGLASGRILAQEVKAPFDLPLFTSSGMDGFAVRAQDIQEASPEKPVVLTVTGEVRAGHESHDIVQPGKAIRIMTGAMLPEGADAVVPVELTDQNNRGAGMPAVAQVSIFQPVAPQASVRRSGHDVQFNQTLIKEGSLLRPQEIGLLAMFGLPTIEVYRQPRVAIFSTGDELLPVGVPLQPGKIYQSNSYSLAAQLKLAGATVEDLGVAPDQFEAVQGLFERAVEKKADLIISSAGVSVGAFDYVRSVIENQGSLEFWKVNIRPGKPIAFGNYRTIPFIGLPGNPVSAFICFEVFARPAILKMCGGTSWQRPKVRVLLADSITSDGRESYLRAVVVRKAGTWVAHLTGNQDSGNLSSLVLANAFLIVPSEVKSLPIGAELDAWIIGEVFEDE